MELLRADIGDAGYPGSQKIVENIKFSLFEGELLGLIGPNGAGKSTILKTIIGLLPVRHSKIEFVGSNQSYAYVPEQPVLYDRLTLWEHLELAGAAYELERREFKATAESLLKLFHLDKEKNYLPVNFSKGMQQKVMLVIGFLVKPDVYIIDEPFMGLDPRATKEFLQLLEKERQRGAGILISTHQLDVAERICKSFLLIADGNISAKGTLNDIRNQCNLPGGSLFDCFNKILEGA